jgi:hypothetical protein
VKVKSLIAFVLAVAVGAAAYAGERPRAFIGDTPTLSRAFLVDAFARACPEVVPTASAGGAYIIQFDKPDTQGIYIAKLNKPAWSEGVH